MRDLDRLREKREIVLDERQLATVAVAALVLLGVSFALGLVVGRRMPPPAVASDDLAVLDVKAAPEKAAPPGKPAPEKAAPRVEGRPDPKPAPAEPARAPEAPAVAAASPVAEPAGSAPPERAAQRAQPERVVAQQHVSVVPPPPRAVTAPAPVVLTAPPRDVGNFTVQVGAAQDRAEAERIEARARAAGLKPYVVSANLGPRGTWYRVRVGAFRDKDAAARFRIDVERELRLTAVVMPTH